MQLLTTCRKKTPDAQLVSEQGSHLLANFPSYTWSMMSYGKEYPFGQPGSAVPAALSQILVHPAGPERLKSP